MGRHSLVALLVTTVLFDVLQVVPPDDNGASHFCRGHNALEDATADAHVAGKRTLLINVCSLFRNTKVRKWLASQHTSCLFKITNLDCSDRGFEAEANITSPSRKFALLAQQLFVARKYNWLALK